MNKHRGFTLLELLIVIGILAVLAAVTVVVLNPAELLRRARDTRRIADINAVRSALSFYMTEVTSPAMGGDAQTSTTCGTNSWFGGPGSATSAPFTTTNVTTSGVISGTGWIPVNLATTAITGGSPLSNYPIDPVNTGQTGSPSTRYGYVCEFSPSQFTLFANMESTQYKTGGAGDVESRDGGFSTLVYEVGTKLGIASGANFTTWYPNNP